MMNKSRATNLIALLIIAAGYFSPVFRRQILSLGFFALSGALTNWAAIHMLFEKVPLLYGSGVIPGHFAEIKDWIRNLIMVRFFSQENLDHYIDQGEELFLEIIQAEDIVNKVNYHGVFDKVKAEILASKAGGMLAVIGGGNLLEKYREPAIEKIREYITKELTSRDFLAGVFRDGKEKAVPLVREKVDEIVLDTLDQLTPRMIKDLVKDMMEKHMGWLVVWGGVFGGLIGLAMSFIPGI